MPTPAQSGLFNTMLRWLMPFALLLMGTLTIGLLSQRAELWAFDVLSRWTALHRAPSGEVAVLVIDDASLEKLKSRYGLPPWPRSAYVDIFRRLQAVDPAVTIFDGHFMHFRREEDQAVFDGLRKIPNLVVGMIHQPDAPGGDPAGGRSSMPGYYHLNLGVVNVPQDPADGIIRSVQPLFLPSQRTPGIYPALSVAGVLAYLQTRQPSVGWNLNLEHPPGQPARLSLFSENGQVPAKVFPLDERQGIRLIWYPQVRSPHTLAYVTHPLTPLWQVLEQPEKYRPLLSGKMLLLGSIASFDGDFHHTPVAIHHAGVDIQATALDNLLQEASIRQIPAGVNALLIAGLFLLMAATRYYARSLERSLLYTIGSMIIYLWVAYVCFNHFNLAIAVVTPEVAILLGFLVGNTLLVRRRDRQVLLLEGHLSKLVSKDVYKEIKGRSQIISQGGHKRDITTMLVDIRNFTSLAEALAPQDVSELLNEFYTIVVDTVFEHRGTVDKFMGDGVLILFGAPLPDTQHASQAIKAGGAILEKSRQLIAHWKSNRGIDTGIGISIHSGSAFVGFIGPKNKLEYTAIGDTVNLCVRLQEQAKRFKTSIIVSHTTVSALYHGDGPQPFRPLGVITVRGRENPIEVYTLPAEAAGPEEAAGPDPDTEPS